MFQILPQQLCPGSSNSPAQFAHTSSAVPPGLQYHPAPGENTQCIRLEQLELWKSTQEENQEVTDFMSTSQRHVLLPPTCPTAMAGGWHWTLVCGFGEISDTPSCWGGGERWCFIWVAAPAEGLLFSQLCTAMDMPSLSWNCVLVLAGCSAAQQWGQQAEPYLWIFLFFQVSYFIYNLERTCSCLCKKKKKKNGSEHSTLVSFFIAIIKAWILTLECPYLKWNQISTLWQGVLHSLLTSGSLCNVQHLPPCCMLGSAPQSWHTHIYLQVMSHAHMAGNMHYSCSKLYTWAASPAPG